MNFDTAVVAFGIASLAIGVTLLTIYSSFGPGSDKLIDEWSSLVNNEAKKVSDNN